jgi:agmatinase
MKVPRYSGIATFLKLPYMPEDTHSSTEYDIAVFGIPFDNAATYRSGARFGPDGVRRASKKLRAAGYQPGLGMFPFWDHSVVDAGDAAVTPFDIRLAMEQAYDFAMSLHKGGLDKTFKPLVMIGGDHLVPIATLRALHDVRGGDGVCLIHFDAHMDTTDEYFGEKFTHGTTFKRAHDNGYFRKDCSISVGLRGGWSGAGDEKEHRALGFDIITPDDFDDQGFEASVKQIRDRVGRQPVYITVDIDVLDPAFAPGTGTLEPGGMQTREVLRLLRALKGLCILGADVVEVAPAYDHMEITQLAGAYVALDLVGLVGHTKSGNSQCEAALKMEL